MTSVDNSVCFRTRSSSVGLEGGGDEAKWTAGSGSSSGERRPSSSQHSVVDSALKMSSDDNRLEVMEIVVGVATSGSLLTSANGNSLLLMVIVCPLMRLLLIRMARDSGWGVAWCTGGAAATDAADCGVAVGLW